MPHTDSNTASPVRQATSIIDDIVADLEDLGENVETALKESDIPAAEEEGDAKRT